MIEQLPLLRKKGSGWEPAVSVAQPPILIKRHCPTAEAQKRFLGVRPEADILNSHRRNNNGNTEIPYRHSDCEGEWLFYFAGQGKTNQGRKVNLWDVWFVPNSQLNRVA